MQEGKNNKVQTELSYNDSIKMIQSAISTNKNQNNQNSKRIQVLDLEPAIQSAQPHLAADSHRPQQRSKSLKQTTGTLSKNRASGSTKVNKEQLIQQLLHIIEQRKDYEKIKDQLEQVTKENNQLKRVIMELQAGRGGGAQQPSSAFTVQSLGSQDQLEAPPHTSSANLKSHPSVTHVRSTSPQMVDQNHSLHDSSALTGHHFMSKSSVHLEGGNRLNSQSNDRLGRNVSRSYLNQATEQSQASILSLSFHKLGSMPAQGGADGSRHNLSIDFMTRVEAQTF